MARGRAVRDVRAHTRHAGGGLEAVQGARKGARGVVQARCGRQRVRRARRQARQPGAAACRAATVSSTVQCA